MQDFSKVYILIPLYNEAEVIENVIKELSQIFQNIVVVNDGSTDGSLDILKTLDIHLINHPINMGQGSAISTGFNYIYESDAEALITFDADGQHSVEDAEIFANAILDSDYDVIFGSRFIKHSKNIPFIKRCVLILATKITNYLSKMHLTDTHNGMKAIKKDSLSKINIEINGYAFESEFIQCISKRKLKYSEIPTNIIYTEYSKWKGQSLMNGFIILEDLIKMWLKK